MLLSLYLVYQLPRMSHVISFRLLGKALLSDTCCADRSHQDYGQPPSPNKLVRFEGAAAAESLFYCLTTSPILLLQLPFYFLSGTFRIHDTYHPSFMTLHPEDQRR